jgi:hypothetical protein
MSTSSNMFPDKFKAEPTSDKHYEDKYVSWLWQMIKKRAEEKDMSYADAYTYEIRPELMKLIRYRDNKFEDDLIQKRNREIAELREIESKIGPGGSKCL